MGPLEPLVLVLGLFVGSVAAANGISREDLDTARYVVQHLPLNGAHQTWHGTWVRSSLGKVEFLNNDGTRLDFHFQLSKRGPIPEKVRVDIGALT